jgi:hypothetical protein
MTNHTPTPAGDDRAKMMTWEQTSSMLIELAERLDPNRPVELIIAGGAAMTSAGLRPMTADVDVVSDLPADVLSAAMAVADDRDLSASWLNANARPFLPSRAHAHVILQRGPLTVRAVITNDLFVMKLDAARPATSTISESCGSTART